METYYNANHAFNCLKSDITQGGADFANTKALFNVGFYLQNPLDNIITNPERNWKLEYAEAEWQWYLSGDRNIKKLGKIYGKIPPIWERMADHRGRVNSNYGWQWLRNDQYEYIIDKLKHENDTRHAAISIYDGKENIEYENDTPCTYAVQFTIINDRLCMSVYMRSNDLWYGFCNDQYCFSMLQKKVSEDVNKEIGWYYHHAHNMHIYNDKL
jgi:thymidylate synthase